ncbi:MAG: EAL domain-containing protein [Deltaproteobacteria bacterium]|nr:EAL domain-containing protein [Deltaproteobacteria bacterium]
MAQQGRYRVRSILLKIVSIQFFSILLTVTLVSGFSLAILSNYHAASQREKLEAHAQSLAIEADQLLNQLIFRLENLNTYDYHRYFRSELLIKSFTEYSRFFPNLAYFEKQGEPVIKVIKGRNYSGPLTPLNPALLQRVMQHPNQVILSVTDRDPDFPTPVIVLTQARIGYFGDEFQGIVQATIPTTQFAELFSRRYAEQGISLVLTTADGRILLPPQSGKHFSRLFPATGNWLAELAQPVGEHIAFGERLIENQQSYYSYKQLDNYPWLVFAIMPRSLFDRLLHQLIWANISLAIFGLLIGSGLAYIMVRPVLNNIRRIKQQTQNLAAGRLDERVEVTTRDELQELAEAVNTLTEKLRRTSAAYNSVDLMLQTVINPLLICDIDGAIFKTNAAAQELFAVSETDFHGRSLSCYFSHRSPLADRALLLEMLQQPQLKNYATEIQVADGTTVPVNFCFAHAYEKDGADCFIVCLFEDISAQKAAETEIAQLAYFDSLTGLPNRELLHDRLDMVIRHAERAQGEYRRFAVMFLDLDHFKMVNDTLGHSIGDQLLQSAAERLKNCLRLADTVSRSVGEKAGDERGEEHVLARLGGDEFIILLPLLRSPEDAGVVARQIITDMAKPFALEGHEVVTPASIGLAIYPDDGTDSETLLRCADVAMYHAKGQGRNSFYYYTDEMNNAARERLTLEHHLRHDIECRQGFYLVYQPQVAVQDNRLFGMEVLVRWRHDELGEVSPVRFIPIAEDSGLIVPLGKWILETACQQLQDWIERGGTGYKIAVNLSGRQLKQPDLLQMVTAALHSSGLAPQLLELELTESMLMETVEKTILLMRELKHLGVSLAIDDFGTGYSSLNYLKRFPIDTLKIDRSFIRDLESDPDDAAIIEAIIAMAKSLRLQVVAEGVETEMQLEFLRHRGAHQYQGFLFSKPLSAEEFARRYIDI